MIKKVLFSFSALITFIYLLGLAYIYVYQEEMVFNIASGRWQDTHDFAKGSQFFWLERPDGARLYGIDIPPYGEDYQHGEEFEQSVPELAVDKLASLERIAHENEDLALRSSLEEQSKKRQFKTPILLFYKGNARNISTIERLTKTYLEHGYRVISMDYRQYGQSTGELTQEALYQDAEALYDFVKEQYPNAPLLVAGYSLGTTFASHVASKRLVDDLIFICTI